MSIAVQFVNGDPNRVHQDGEKWVTDDERNLVVLDKKNKAVAIYAHNHWRAAVTV